MALNIGKTWSGANGFSRFLFVLNALSIIGSIATCGMYLFTDPQPDYASMNVVMKEDYSGIPKGTSVKIVNGDGANFTIMWAGRLYECNLSDLKIV